jgi:hypothetical protein
MAGDAEYCDGLVATEVTGRGGIAGMVGFVTEGLVGMENGFNVLIGIRLLLSEPGKAGLALGVGFVIGEWVPISLTLCLAMRSYLKIHMM